MEILDFLDRSYTAYHATANSVDMLSKNGFIKLDMSKKWTLNEGGRYYVTQNGTSVIAFIIGKNFVFNIAESHTDSPCLHVKGNSLVDSSEGARINVEKYGGLILYSMLDIPLKVAGRLILKESGGFSSKLVESAYNVNIPSLAIHHNPTVNDSFSVSVQKDMLPLIGNASELYSTLCDGEIIDADLFVVPAIKAYFSGIKNEYLCSARIDNLTSVYSSIRAICKCNPQNISITCCFDNEEIGSETKQGANSSLLSTVLEKITRGMNKTSDDFVSACQNGFILSIDNAHAVHPSFTEKSDLKERVYMNEGIVIKHHAKYSTDGLSSAIVKNMLDKAGIQYQDYYNHSDIRCGSTIGLMTSARLCMRSCDIGIAQLAMHSGIETAGATDIEKMQKCAKTFFESSFAEEDIIVK